MRDEENFFKIYTNMIFFLLAKRRGQRYPPRRIYSISSSDSDDTEPTPAKRTMQSTGWITSRRVRNYNRHLESTPPRVQSSVIVGTHTIHNSASPASPPSETIHQQDENDHVNSLIFLFAFS